VTGSLTEIDQMGKSFLHQRLFSRHIHQTPYICAPVTLKQAHSRRGRVDSALRHSEMTGAAALFA